MGNLVYLAIAIGLSTLGVVTLWVVRHRPRSMQHQIDDFSRELRALRSSDVPARRHEAHLDRVEPMPIRPNVPDPPPPAARTPEPPQDRRRSATES